MGDHPEVLLLVWSSPSFALGRVSESCVWGEGQREGLCGWKSLGERDIRVQRQR